MKSGFCFTSQKTYQVGEGLIVACPYNATGRNVERPARVVRRLDLEGPHRKVYGVPLRGAEDLIPQRAPDRASGGTDNDASGTHSHGSEASGARPGSTRP